jgi:TorA maturation chaperone TorD
MRGIFKSSNRSVNTVCTGKKIKTVHAAGESTEDTATELAEILVIRGCVYDMLRRLFLLGPEENIISDFFVLATAYRELDEAACYSWERRFSSQLQTMRLTAIKTVSRQLKPEFTRLFIGPRQVPAPPYESCYRSPERVLMQAMAIQVREQYRSAGLEVKRLNREPDDHIGLELEFMYYLNHQASAALMTQSVPALLAALERQDGFLTRHLSEWTTAFCDDIAANARQEFYRCLAEFLNGFILTDCVQLKQMLQNAKKIKEGNL